MNASVYHKPKTLNHSLKLLSFITFTVSLMVCSGIAAHWFNISANSSNQAMFFDTNYTINFTNVIRSQENTSILSFNYTQTSGNATHFWVIASNSSAFSCINSTGDTNSVNCANTTVVQNADIVLTMIVRTNRSNYSGPTFAINSSDNNYESFTMDGSNASNLGMQLSFGSHFINVTNNVSSVFFPSYDVNYTVNVTISIIAPAETYITLLNLTPWGGGTGQIWNVSNNASLTCINVGTGGPGNGPRVECTNTTSPGIGSGAVSIIVNISKSNQDEQFKVYTKDNYLQSSGGGIMGMYSNEIVVKIDNMPPTVIVTSPQNASNLTSFYVSATISESMSQSMPDNNSVYYRIINETGNYTPWTQMNNVTALMTTGIGQGYDFSAYYAMNPSLTGPFNISINASDLMGNNVIQSNLTVVLANLEAYFTNFPPYSGGYFNINGKLMIFASEYMNLTGYVNGTNFANWTISLENSGGIVNSSLCFGDYSVNGTFCNWNTTEYCAGECENYTLILSANDLVGNGISNWFTNITIDNLAPNISIIESNVSDNHWTVRTNVTENYLSELDAFVFNGSNSLIAYWANLCNESQGNNCSGSGSGISNMTWGFDTYSLNNDSVPLFYGLMLDSYFVGDSHPGEVPGCFASNGSNYDCGGIMPNGKPYTYYLVYNFSGGNVSLASLVGIGSEQWCAPDTGCVLNTTIIQNGTSKFMPQAKYLINYSSNEWTISNLTEITLYSIGNSNNTPLVNIPASIGNYTFIFEARDYAGWGASSGITEYITIFGGLNSNLNPDIFSWQNISGALMGFAYRTMNLTGYVNGTNFANWTISLENSGGIVNSSLCFGDYSVNGTFCAWNTTEYCAGECENYTLILNATDSLGNWVSNWFNNITIDNLVPTIDIITVSVNGSNVFARANITEKYLYDDAAYILNESNYSVVGWGRFCGENQTDSCQQLGQGTFNRTWQSEVYYLNNTLLSVNNKFGFVGSNFTISAPGCFASNGSNYDCGGICENQSSCSTYRWWLVYNDSNHNGGLLGLANDQWCGNGGCVINDTIIQNGTSKFKLQTDYFDFNNSEWLHDNSTVVTLYNIGEPGNMDTTFMQATNGTYKFAFEARDYAGWTALSSLEFNASQNLGPGPGVNSSINLILLNSGARPNVGDTLMFLINVTNTGGTNITNLNLSDEFDVNYNYTAASLGPDGVDYANHIISWNNIPVNVSQGQSYLLYVNFTALSAAHNVLNRVNSTVYTFEGSSTNSYSLNFEIGENISPNIVFIDATTTEAGNYSRNAIWANVSVVDSSAIDSITIFLFNSSGLHTSSTNNTINPSNAYLFANFTNLHDGTYTMNATTNDTWGNINSTESRTIVLDTTSPTLTINSPLTGANLNSRTITINLTATDANFNYTNISLYNATGSLVNSSINTTNGNFVTSLSVPVDGLFTINATVHDLVGNINSTSVNVTVDTIAPTYSNNLTYPLSPATYSQGQQYQFNITWAETNGVSLARLNFNGENYTMSNASSVYSYTLTDLSVGNYTYYFWANDYAGNSNQTNVSNYIINKAPQALTLVSSTGNSFTYGTATTITGAGNSTLAVLYQNESVKTSPYAVTLAAGGYNFTWNSTGNENYTANSTSIIVTVNKAAGDVSCYLNGSETNLTLDIGNSGTYIWLNATLNNEAGNINLYKNGTLINSGSSPLANYTIFNSTGLYNITVIYSATQNYTASSETYWVNATDNTAPAITVLSPSNTGYFVGQLIRINFSASDLSGVSSLWYYNTTENVTFDSENYLNLTNDGYTFIFYANDSYNNIVNESVSFNITELASNQAILNDSNFEVGGNTTEIILPTNQSLTAITIPLNISETEPITLNLGQRIDSNGDTSFEGNVSMTRTGSSANYSVEIPSGVVISGGSNWSGDFKLPTLESTSGLDAPSISGYTTTLEKIISVGSSNELNFSSPVKLVIGGMAGKKAAWSRNSAFINILVYCDNNESTPTNINSSARECYTNDSTNTDLIIWTYHFTEFAAYSLTAIVNNNPGGGGGGGGAGGGVSSGSQSVTLATVTQGIPAIASFSDTMLYITRVNITLSKSASNVKITVTNLNMSPIGIASPEGMLFKYADITTQNIVSSDMEKVKIQFRVNISWYTTNNLDPLTTKLNRYSSGVWAALETVQVSSNDTTYYYFEADSPGLSTFAITASPKGTTPTPTTCSSTCPAGQSQKAYPDCSCYTPAQPPAQPPGEGITPASNYDWVIYVLVIVVVTALLVFLVVERIKLAKEPKIERGEKRYHR